MKHAVKFWWLQRMSAIFILPFFLYILFFIAKTSGNINLALTQHPFALFAFFSAIIYHGTLGMQVILEDYISCTILRNIFIAITYSISALTVLAMIFILVKFIA